MANLVKFYQTDSALLYTQQWIANPDDYRGALVFASDTGEIYLDGKPYGSGTISSSALKDINDKLATLENAHVAIDMSTDNGRDENGNFIFSFVNTSGTVVDSISIPVVTTTKSGVMSAEDKLKLDSIDANNIVYRDGDKVLSSNDYTDEEKELLSTVKENAEPNIIEVVKVDEVALEVVDKTVNINFTERVNEIVGDKLSRAYVYKGSVNTESELPVDAAVGDVYNIVASSNYGGEGTNVAWNGTEWDALGGAFSTADITKDIEAIEQDIKDINAELEKLSGADTKIADLETAVETLNGDESVEGSVANTATTISTTIIDEKLTWQYINQ